MFETIRNIFSKPSLARSQPTPPGVIGSTYITNSRRSISDEIVDDESIMQLAPFTRAAELISTTVARVAGKSCVYYDRATGREKAKDHAAQKAIKFPEAYRTGFTTFKQLISDGLVYGNGYLRINYDGAFRIKGLKWLNPKGTYPVLDQLTGELVGYRSGGDTFAPWEVVHYRGLGCRHNPYLGMSIYDRCRESLGWCLSVQRYGSVYLSKQGRLGTMQLITDKETKFGKGKEEFIKELNRQIEEGEIPAFDQGMKLDGIAGPTAEQSQLLGSLEQIAIVCSNVTGIPSYKLGAKVNNSYGSTEAENLALLSDLYDGVLANLESELTLKLLTEQEKQSGKVFIEFNRDVLLSADKNIESQRLIAEYQAGILSWEEVRQIKNMPTDVDGEFADAVAQPVADQAAAVDSTDPTQVVPTPITEKPAATAEITLLNGAQVQSAQALCEAVAAKTLPAFVAEQLLIAVGIPANTAKDMAAAAEALEPPKPEPSPFAKAPAPDQQPADGEAIARASFNQLIERIRKDAYRGKDAFLQRHETIFRSRLPDQDKFVTDFFDRLTTELDAVLPDQRQTVLDSIDIEKEFKNLWKSQTQE